MIRLANHSLQERDGAQLLERKPAPFSLVLVAEIVAELFLVREVTKSLE